MRFGLVCAPARGECIHPVVRNWVALFVVAELGWTTLSWTVTAEQIIFGVVASAIVATACAPLGGAAGLWRVLEPRRALTSARLAVVVVRQMVAANVSLSRRIWTPSLPLRPGMVVVPTAVRTDAGLTAVGVLTSLIVDNQLVDVDRAGSALQYHAVWVASEDGVVNRSRINGPVEDLVAELEAP